MKNLISVMGISMLAVACGSQDFSGTYTGNQIQTQNNSAYSTGYANPYGYGNLNNNTSNQTTTLSLVQSGTEVSGNMTLGNLNGTVSGTANGNQITGLTFQTVGSNCTGAYTGSLTKGANDQLTGTLAGNTSCGNLNTTLTLNKSGS